MRFVIIFNKVLCMYMKTIISQIIAKNLVSNITNNTQKNAIINVRLTITTFQQLVELAKNI